MTESFLKKVFILIAVMVIANCLYFTYVNAIPLVKSDGWRFICLYLEPWYQGNFDWRILWMDHHPQPFTGLLFIANAEWFGLNMKYEALFSLGFAPLLLFTILSCIRKTFDNGEAKFFYYIALLVVCIIFSLTSPNVYTWSLVTKGFITSFFAVLVVAILDSKQLGSSSATSWFVGGLNFSLLLILFGDSATIFLVGCLAVLCVNFCLYRDKKILIWIAVLITAKLLHLMFMRLIGGESHYQGKFPAEILSHLWVYISYIGVGLLSAWTNLKALSLIGVPVEIIPYLGVVTLLIYALTLFKYFSKGMSRVSMLPGVFIFVGLITGVAGSVFRFNPDSYVHLSGNVPRYYLQYSLAVVGVLWVWFYYLGQRRSKATYSYAILAVLVIAVSLSQFLATMSAWNLAPYVQKSTKNSYGIMLQNATGDFSVIPPRYMLGNNYPKQYKSGLNFLKENNLNLFSMQNGKLVLVSP